jgi:hypothetical protein
MQFIKKHYEKVLLSIVLLGLLGAAAALPITVGQVQQSIEDTRNSVVRKKLNPWVTADLSTNQAMVRRLQGPLRVQLSDGHNVFNPVRWEQTSQSNLVKIARGSEVGSGAVRVNRIGELKLKAVFEGVTGGERPQYSLTITREADGPGRKATRSAPLGVRGEHFTVLEVVGSPTAPEGVIVRLKDIRDAVTIRKDAPFERVVAYEADLEYPPENQTFPRKRVGDKLTLRGRAESYKIVAITPEEIVLASEPKGKRTTIQVTAARQ